ncbi:conjugative transposon protein TraM [Flagellimonas nanhaiensis]|uniref:Conjugative transposon protein TraM n=1 Tax=Flagellimonas nanhaiensis TaxID=2292706 RepID=A0A371JN50_9FLAO|nr:conjugative transposon protein TraM [Allomuricauda nanhaiensis]RDY58600.1 conjugative transposon protein TraM [Allomuricauda nanhaiensis]
MKVEKNKIVFALVLICVVLFIGTYAFMVLGEDEEPTIENNQIPVPELGEEQKEYKSRLDALDDLKEIRETNAPSIYDERLLDSTGVYDPDLLEKQKMKIIDSIYNEGRINYSDASYRKPKIPEPPKPKQKDTIKTIVKDETSILVKELALEHQLFFASNPQKNGDIKPQSTDEFIYAHVDGTQTVRKDYRLQMRLTKEALINSVVYPRNTQLYGFISFKPNRTIITIENINHKPINLKSFDLQDGSEGINIVNSFRAEATQEIVGDVVDDINIVGVPQVSGIKRIFQRNNRRVKATIYNNYKLILKADNRQ